MNRKIVLYDGNNNDHQFYGFGINSGVLRYQVDGVVASHVFYSGTSTSTSEELMRIGGDGNVGIGTSNPLTRLSVGPELLIDNDASYHNEALSITSNATPTSDTVLNDPIPLIQLAREGTAAEAWGALANFSLSRFANDGVESNTRLDIDLAHTIFTDPQTVMTLLAGGNVGIGTTTPSETLSVNGNARITGALHDSSGDAGSNGQVLSSTAAGTNWVSLSSDEIRDTDGDTKIQVEEGTDDDRIRFDTAGSERAVITNTGNVGIGTSTPLSRLFLGDSDIAGSSTAAVVEPDALVIGSDRLLTNGTNINVPQPLLQLFRRGTLSSGPKANFGLSRYTSSNTNANSRLDIQLADLGPTSSVNVMTLLANGNVGIGAFPTASLHVDGDLRVEDIPAANNNSDVLLKADSNGNLRSAGVDYRDIAIQATALSENISTGRGESYFVVGDEHDGKTIREIAYSIFTISGSYGANDVLVTIRKRRANSPSVVTIAQNVNPALNGSSTGSFFNQVTGITNATLVKGDIIFIDLTVNSSPGHQGLSITLSTN